MRASRMPTSSVTYVSDVANEVTDGRDLLPCPKAGAARAALRTRGVGHCSHRLFCNQVRHALSCARTGSLRSLHGRVKTEGFVSSMLSRAARCAGSSRRSLGSASSALASMTESCTLSGGGKTRVATLVIDRVSWIAALSIRAMLSARECPMGIIFRRNQRTETPIKNIPGIWEQQFAVLEGFVLCNLFEVRCAEFRATRCCKNLTATGPLARWPLPVGWGHFLDIRRRSELKNFPRILEPR